MKLLKIVAFIISFAAFAVGCSKTQDNVTTGSGAVTPGTSTSTTTAKPSVTFKISNRINDSTLLEGNVLDFTVDARNAVSYLWNFGDGQTSTLKTPVFYYTVCSTKLNVSLTVANSRGETATYIQPFLIQCCRGYNNHPPVTTPTHVQ